MPRTPISTSKRSQGTKQCSKCRLHKPGKDYAARGGGGGRPSSCCHACRNIAVSVDAGEKEGEDGSSASKDGSPSGESEDELQDHGGDAQANSASAQATSVEAEVASARVQVANSVSAQFPPLSANSGARTDADSQSLGTKKRTRRMTNDLDDDEEEDYLATPPLSPSLLLAASRPAKAATERAQGSATTAPQKTTEHVEKRLSSLEDFLIERLARLEERIAPLQGSGKCNESPVGASPTTVVAVATPAPVSSVPICLDDGFDGPSQDQEISLKTLFPWVTDEQVKSIGDGVFKPEHLHRLADPESRAVKIINNKGSWMNVEEKDGAHPVELLAAFVEAIPDPVAFHHCWAIYSAIVGRLSRHSTLETCLQRYASDLFERSRLQKWESLMRYHLAFWRKYPPLEDARRWLEADANLLLRYLLGDFVTPPQRGGLEIEVTGFTRAGPSSDGSNRHLGKKARRGHI